MNILLHICCGPCAIVPVDALRRQGHVVTGYFHNPNIHPYREFKKRLAGASQLAEACGLAVNYDRQYGLRQFLRQVVFHEQSRCLRCYEMRLAATASLARQEGADAFTTSLLYSRHQKHDVIRAIGERLADEYGIAFCYEDFRVGWQEGIDRAIAMELYRQAWCGCIYSEEERYDRKFARRMREQQEGNCAPDPPR